MKEQTTNALTLVVVSVALSLLCACNAIEYHPYDARVDGETGLTTENITLIEEQTAGKREIRFAMISDTQRHYDEMEDAVDELNTRDDIDFVLHGGDLADFGTTDEFEWARDYMSELDVPWVCILGNHDCLGTGLDVFESVFGDIDFAFTAGNVRFICLNTNALEFDYSDDVPNFTFLQSELEAFPSDVAEKTVIVMHAPPFGEEFNNDVADEFETAITTFPNPLFCLYGHIHSWAEDDFFDDGLIYYACTNIANRGYYLITINDDGYEIERCDF